MIKQYMKQAVRQLRENGLVSLISIAGTALAIAVILVMVLVFQINSAGFAPESNRGRILKLVGTEVRAKSNTAEGSNRGNMSDEVVKSCFRTLQIPEVVSAYRKNTYPLSLPGRQEFREYQFCYTDAGYWKVFDHEFLEGAPFDEADFRSGLPKAVLSEHTARQLFGSEPAVGREVVVDYVAYRVCGVVRDVPDPQMTSYFEVCLPYTSDVESMRSGAYGERMIGLLSVVVLARTSSDFDAIRAELAQQVKRYNAGKVDYELHFPVGLVSQLDVAMGTSEWQKVDWRDFLAESGSFLLLLLLVPALNLTGVVQSSVQKRREEFGVRKAFGATGSVLWLQIIVENLVLTLIGGAIGLFLSFLLLLAGKSFVLNDGIRLTLPMLVRPGLFLAALFFTFLLNLLSAGIPAWHTLRQPIVESIKGNE